MGAQKLAVVEFRHRVGGQIDQALNLHPLVFDHGQGRAAAQVGNDPTAVQVILDLHAPIQVGIPKGRLEGVQQDDVVRPRRSGRDELPHGENPRPVGRAHKRVGQVAGPSDGHRANRAEGKVAGNQSPGTWIVRPTDPASLSVQVGTDGVRFEVVEECVRPGRKRHSTERQEGDRFQSFLRRFHR